MTNSEYKLQHRKDNLIIEGFRESLRIEVEKGEQYPVAWMHKVTGEIVSATQMQDACWPSLSYHMEPLYTHKQRELSDEDM